MPFKRNKQEITSDEETSKDAVRTGGWHHGAPAACASDRGRRRRPRRRRSSRTSSTQPAGRASAEKLAGISRGRLGNLLIERNLVTEAQLEQGLAAAA